MLIVASIFIFIVAVIFRLLDNSAGLLISNGISVSPFYLPRETILEEIDKLENPKLIRKLRRNLIFQKLHKGITVLSVVTLVVGVAFEIYEPELIYLF